MCWSFLFWIQEIVVINFCVFACFKSALSNPFTTRHMWRMTFKMWRIAVSKSHKIYICFGPDFPLNSNFSVEISKKKAHNVSFGAFWLIWRIFLPCSFKCGEWPYSFATVVANGKILLDITDLNWSKAPSRNLRLI